MSLRFCTHPWEVKDLEDGTLVILSQRDLDPETVSVLVDELHELALESGRPILYLDFGHVGILASVVIGKLIALDRRLHENAGKLVLGNVDPDLFRLLQISRVTDSIDVRGNWDFPSE